MGFFRVYFDPYDVILKEIKTVQRTFYRAFKCIKEEQLELAVDVDNPWPSTYML